MAGSKERLRLKRSCLLESLDKELHLIANGHLQKKLTSLAGIKNLKIKYLQKWSCLPTLDCCGTKCE